jgi:hypothetical protein
VNQTHDWYTNPDWRNAYVEETIRCLSKTGSLRGDEVLYELADVLPKEDVVELYVVLRQSMRPESEWKPEFLSIFSHVEDSDLPPIAYDQPEPKTEEPPRNRQNPRPTLSSDANDDIPY